jgi:hypothetical protein
MKAPLPENESNRLAALKQYDILDTLPEQSFDDLTYLASYICDVPVALITLIDEKRQWFKSNIGFDFAETSRDISFCTHAIHQSNLLVVKTLRKMPDLQIIRLLHLIRTSAFMQARRL